MLQQIDKKQKLFIYFFLLLMLTTFNNLSLINSEYLKLKIKQIKVSGLNVENNLKISEDFNKSLYQKNIFLISKDNIVSILKKIIQFTRLKLEKSIQVLLKYKLKKQNS